MFNITPQDCRLTTYPIARKDLWELYKQARNCIWVPEEIDFTHDRSDYEFKLSNEERHFVNTILAFFASADGIVNINLMDRFLDDVNILEAKYFYRLQAAIEDIHAECYSIMLDTIINNHRERERLLNAAAEIPIIKKMIDWADTWIKSNDSLGKRLIGMACVEGIFFSGCFCAIFWFAGSGRMPGLTTSNKLISRDEGLHTKFAVALYRHLNTREAQADVHNIVRRSVEIGHEFTQYALPVRLACMNSELMLTHIKSVADELLQGFGYEPLYGGLNTPFDFMQQINIPTKTNFFEQTATEYARIKSVDLNTNDFDVVV